MRKFNVPRASRKQAWPKAVRGEDLVHVVGISHADKAQRLYYEVCPTDARDEVESVRCDYLIAL